jgi:hypothetical protein
MFKGIKVKDYQTIPVDGLYVEAFFLRPER